jgi:tetratricopeptide (TPR) repeat protein
LLETSETDDPLDSTDAEAHYNYGNLLEETNRPEKAEKHYRQALLETSETGDPLDSTLAQAHLNYGVLLKETNRPEKAGKHYRQALLETSETDDPLDSTDAEAHSNYGVLLKEMNRPEKAEKYYRRALLETSETADPLDSTYADAHSNYGVLLEETNRPKKAGKHYRQALLETSETADPLDSTYADTHYNYGNLLKETNRPEKAEEHYRQALLETSETDDPLDSTYAEAHYNYGLLLFKEERLSEARSHIERSVELWQEQDRPQNVLSDIKLLVVICDRLGDHDAAIRHCERAIELGHEIGDIETEREFRKLYARLDGRDVSDKVSEQYGFALQAVVRREFETAAELFGAAWRHREDFSDHQPPYWMTFAGGLWLRALVSVSEVTMDDETDAEIRSTVESATDRLSITTRELYRWLYNEGALSAPAHLRMSVTDDDTITQLELDAYETLVQLLEQ